ncbi:BatD family protein [Thiomicrorhabdus sediminis]|nr:BatD family protein [Thiomicrorhabdus sediminis]
MQICLLGVLCLAANSAIADSISVKADRDKVELSDIITVIVETDFQIANASLDTSILQDQFDVLSRQQSNQIQIINGDFSSTTRWQLRLVAKQTGKLMIPPFELKGVKSKPYPIEVTKPSYKAGVKPYFLEAKTDLSEVFVQQQVIYTLRFYQQGTLLNGNIRPPNFANAQSETLKEQSVYGKTINGQAYTVYEWRYALFPQQSGVLTIPGPMFTGMLSLGGRQKGIQASAEAIKIKVLPIPQNTPPWLPARQVRIDQNWLNSVDQVHLGDSIGREITIRVEGLKSTQLPKINIDGGKDLKVYIDSEQDGQQLNSNGVTAIKTLKLALVPTATGTITVPKISIRWWNTESQHFQVTELAAQNIEVLAALNSIAPTTPIDGQTTTVVSEHNSDSGYWFYISLIMVVLWLSTLFWVYRLQQRLNALKTLSTSIQAHTTLPEVKALPVESLPQFYHQTLQKLRLEQHIESLHDIENPLLQEQLLALEKHLYQNAELADDCIASIQKEMNAFNKTDHSAKTDSALTALYRPK